MLVRCADEVSKRLAGPCQGVDRGVVQVGEDVDEDFVWLADEGILKPLVKLRG